MDISRVPSTADFKVGDRYLRREIHDEFAGQRQYGISTPAAESFVLIFTDPSSEEHGYRDRFLDNGIFIYSGEGRTGDMTLDGGNGRILNHKENGDELHVFEVVDEANGADVVSYDGQYEYQDHFFEQAPDDNGNMRKAIRFKLEPVGGLNSEVDEEDLEGASDEQLYNLAKQSGTSGSVERTSTGGNGGSSEPSRSEVVRRFARQLADGVCQGCNSEAPFLDANGDPFLEVHHLHRVSDGGLDEPENVIAICPNCHREIHQGQNGDSLNQDLIEVAEDRNQRFI